MKKFNLLIPIIALLTGCSTDAVQKDLLNYVNHEMPRLAALEDEAVAAYDGVAGDNYTNDSIMYSVIKLTVIPRYQEFSDQLASLKPATMEVTAMNHEYVKAANDQLEGFKLICLAIEKQDPEIVRQANSDIDKAKNLLALWKDDLREQCKKHGVVIQEPALKSR